MANLGKYIEKRFENKIIGLIAGGDAAIRKSQEHAEDSITNAWKDLLVYNIDQNDMVIGISASGSTPYVLGGLISCKKNVMISQLVTIAIPV